MIFYLKKNKPKERLKNIIDDNVLEDIAKNNL